MTTPRPTEVQIDADEITVVAVVEEPRITTSVGEIVTTTAHDEPVVQTEVVEVI